MAPCCCFFVDMPSCIVFISKRSKVVQLCMCCMTQELSFLQSEFNYAARTTACVKYALSQARHDLHSTQTGSHSQNRLPHVGHLGRCRECTRWCPLKIAARGRFASPQRSEGSPSSEGCPFHRTARCLHDMHAVLTIKVGSKVQMQIECHNVLCCIALLGFDQTHRCVDKPKRKGHPPEHKRQHGVALSL